MTQIIECSYRLSDKLNKSWKITWFKRKLKSCIGYDRPCQQFDFKPVKSVNGRQSNTGVRISPGPGSAILFKSILNNMDNIKTCDVCGFQTFNGRTMSNHKRWKHITPKGSEEYAKTQLKLKAVRSKRVDVELQCNECGKTFVINVTEARLKSGKYRHYCSSACAHKQGSKNVDYKVISQKMKDNPVGCFSTEWKILHPDAMCSRKNFSKRELEIVSFLKNKFPEDEWKQGFIDGTRKHDGYILSPDCHSDKLKVVIEYDGIWHFKDIHNQLEKKQNVDRALLKFCKEKGYRLIRIDEDLNVSNDMIENAIYKSSSEIELFGSSRYNYLWN